MIYHKIEDYIEQMNDFGYKPYSGEELFIFNNNSYLFTTGGYFEWAYDELKKK